MDQVTVKGGGKYTQVAQRVEVFRKHIGDQLGMESDIVVDDGKRVVIKATIRSRDGFVVATGWAEELRGSNPVNKMACIENTKTKQKRDQLVEADRELNALLNDYYQERYDELNTGER
jgi:hypothetical protein